MSIFDNVTFETRTVKVNSKEKIEVTLGITASDFRDAIEQMAKSVFDDNDIYVSAFREFLRRYIIIKYFTNVEVTDSDMVAIFEASQVGTWFSEIENIVTSLPVWAELERAVDSQIDYIIASRKNSFDKICDKINEIVGAIPDDFNASESLSDVKDVLNKLSDVNANKFVKEVLNKHKK